MASDNLVKAAVLSAIDEYKMIGRSDRVLAAVSGGADSVCLLHILYELSRDMGFTLYCAHLNHGIRGEAADNDERFVGELCKELGIRFFSKRVNAPEIAKRDKLTVEEAGRNARYEFFRELSVEHHIDRIATAHNKNDNIETVLMRIIRGTGIDGLSGIQYVREDGVIRPLLRVSRPEIEEYCLENGLSYCTDKTNLDTEYTRNKVRLELIPYLTREFGEGVVESIDRLSDTAREDSAFLNRYAERLYKRMGNPLPTKKPVVLHKESLKMLERSVCVRVIRAAMRDAGSREGLYKKHIDDIMSLVDCGTGAAVDLPHGFRAEVRYDWIEFIDKNAAEKENAVLGDKDGFFSEIGIGESVYVEALDKKISIREENPREYKPMINEQMLDFGLVNSPLFLRSRRSGDRIVYFKDGRTKKIKSILIDDKIPKNSRDKIPLLATGSEVIAIVGSRVSEKYKINKNTERALVIRYGEINEP